MVEHMRNSYPDHDVVADIGDGYDWRRAGLLKILKKVMADEVEEIVVTHEDQLSTMGYRHLESVFAVHRVRLTRVEIPDEVP